jgi:1,4-alpha-glucan branching enzyme
MATDVPTSRQHHEKPQGGLHRRSAATSHNAAAAARAPTPRTKARSTPPLAPGEIDRIVRSQHDAPHRVLGPQFAEDGSSVAVRAFLPHAAHAVVVVTKPVVAVYSMRPIHRDGLFEAVIGNPGRDFEYEVEVIEGNGDTHRSPDPYAFTTTWFTPDDEAQFTQGRHARLFEKLGTHAAKHGHVHGFEFAVWAPNAQRVSIVGTFNRWDGRCHPMRRLIGSGVWELFLPDATAGDFYKFEIKTPTGDVFLKADPFAFRTERHPDTAGLVCDLDRGFPWGDGAWLGERGAEVGKGAGVTVRRRVDLSAATSSGVPTTPRTFRDLTAGTFLASTRREGVTDIEVAFPLPGRGGSAGFFAPDPGTGTPEDLMELVDAAHQQGLGVIVPTFTSRFSPALTDLVWFDGAPLFEGDGAARSSHGCSFDLDRGEIRSIFLSNALFWVERYHADGWRTDHRTARLLRQLFRLAPKACAGVKLVVHGPPAGLERHDMERLVKARHDDPYILLGPHVEQDGRSLTVRTLLPQADQVAVCLDGEPEIVCELSRVHPDGLFATTLPETDGKVRYRLHVREKRGRTYEAIDPYALQMFAFSDFDQHLLGAGNHYRIYEKLGAHLRSGDGICGVGFAVWAPDAEGVSVVGPFNDWDGRCHAMKRHGVSGVWETFIPGLAAGELYKYEIHARGGQSFLKSDPYAFFTEIPPRTASVVYGLETHYPWCDEAWMEQRQGSNPWRQPMAIYEVHLGSWLRGSDGRHLSYREVGAKLTAYVKRMGFTHIELLPIAEHPYEPSWGYQVSSFYAPTSRFGSPKDLMAFIDACHGNGIGVILDWVPGHFPKDAHALAWFDGTHLYEHADPRKGEHRDWGTLIFNYGRHEVENFLIANALFWLERFHFDGLRVDAVASMLYLDYSKPDPGDWIPNIYGGRENLEAIEFLKHVNAIVHARFPGALMIAEESTAWPKVSRPTNEGGLGFGFKWNMGWMHDVLAYMSTPPDQRRHQHDKLTFGLVYAFDENFILSLSHDEVVHLKGSLLNKMPGEDWEKLANLRLLLSFMYAHPGKKLLFMGGEFGQESEWNHESSLEWHLLEREPHRQLSEFLKDLNGLYRSERAFFETDFRPSGFEWLDVDNAEQSIIAFVRKAKDPRNALVFVMNFSAVSRPKYRFGVPYPVSYREILNSNAGRYGGCGRSLSQDEVWAEEVSCHGRDFSLVMPMPALSAVVLKPADPDLDR